MILKRDVDKYW